MDQLVTKAIKILRDGGIIIYPTDTVFGIGCRIDDEQAIRRLFSLRRRKETQAVPVLVESIGMAGKYITGIPDDVERKLMRQYWPGALTIVLRCKKDLVPSLVRGGTDTLGVRMPNHDIALQLIRGVGMPLLGPSANFHGMKTPLKYEDLDRDLIKLVDFIVPGECQTKEASTVIDATVQPWKILRQGAVAIKI